MCQLFLNRNHTIMISLKSNSKLLLFALATASLVLGSLTPVMAQTTPQQNLEKRNYYFLDNQHLTARYGNTKVCGDHMCGPGEWAKLQNNLNQAQIAHTGNNTKSTPPPQTPTPPVPPTVTPNSTVTTPPVSNPPPTPKTISSSVCMAVKTALGNSTSFDVVAKIMDVLGCK
jgi:hypothetical protein